MIPYGSSMAASSHFGFHSDSSWCGVHCVAIGFVWQTSITWFLFVTHGFAFADYSETMVSNHGY